VFLGGDDLRGLDTGDFIRERVIVGELGETEVAGRQIEERRTRACLFRRMDGGKEIVPLRIQHVQVSDRAGRNDVRNLALHDLPGFGFADLIADGDTFAGLDELADITFVAWWGMPHMGVPLRFVSAIFRMPAAALASSPKSS
jgi:hypothetical protein